MTSRIRYVTIDCTDPDTLGTFWSSALGAPLADDDRPREPEALLDHVNGSALLFVRNDDPKLTKNRVHFDIRPTDRTCGAEVDRLLKLGATIADHRRTNGNRMGVAVGGHPPVDHINRCGSE